MAKRSCTMYPGRICCVALPDCKTILPTSLAALSPERLHLLTIQGCIATVVRERQRRPSEEAIAGNLLPLRRTLPDRTSGSPPHRIYRPARPRFRYARRASSRDLLDLPADSGRAIVGGRATGLRTSQCCAVIAPAALRYAPTKCARRGGNLSRVKGAGSEAGR